MVKINDCYKKSLRFILEEIVSNNPNFKDGGYQNYFHKLKEKEPEKYRALIFNCNGGNAFSKILDSIFRDFKNKGFVGYDNSISDEQRENILKYLEKTS